MNGDVHELWVYLSTTPLLWLTLTLIAYQMGTWVFRRFGSPPLLNPVLLAVTLLVVLLKVSGTDYQTYFRGAQFIHFLLGPATVALAIPLYREVHAVKSAFLPIIIALFIGSLTGIATAMGIGWLLGGEKIVLLTLAPKSVTTPIAMGIAEKIGGLPSLTAVVVVLTGITGAAIGDLILRWLGIKDEMACGMALGVASHGIGTAHAIQRGRVTGAFSALAMALNGLLTAIMLPLIVALLG
jgi:predicted murein hydrolase (TIGR00659 family)